MDSAVTAQAKDQAVVDASPSSRSGPGRRHKASLPSPSPVNAFVHVIVRSSSGMLHGRARRSVIRPPLVPPRSDDPPPPHRVSRQVITDRRHIARARSTGTVVAVSVASVPLLPSAPSR